MDAAQPQEVPVASERRPAVKPKRVRSVEAILRELSWTLGRLAERGDYGDGFHLKAGRALLRELRQALKREGKR